MNQLFAIQDVFSNGYTIEFLDILSIIALLFGITVISNKNPIASLLSLIGLFASISVYLILSGLTFIGFSYLIVYIGAVSILFLFILMLINIRTSELLSNN
jgi:NADH-ubiquinone oxidoreductase chain 6